MPSLRSEFGHPDVAICLTCLSYYYGGLTYFQARECFDLLIKLDNPALEYEKWIQRGGKDIPEPLRRLNGVNMKDIQTFAHDVVPKFRHNQAVIDFFLSHVVFPKESKEFPEKLGTSAWDLAEKKANPTTGFSGTNDNSDLLPTSITQRDPVNQMRTNAQVLEYLLRPENESYICRDINGQVKNFLASLVKDIRVLLDVGAQVSQYGPYELIEVLTAALDVRNDEQRVDQALVIVKRRRRRGRHFFRRCRYIVSSYSGWLGGAALFLTILSTAR